MNLLSVLLKALLSKEAIKALANKTAPGAGPRSAVSCSASMRPCAVLRQKSRRIRTKRRNSPCNCAAAGV